MRNYIRVIVLSMKFLFSTSVCVAAEESPVGEWLVKDKTAHIRILTCDKALWGIISWVETPGADTNNPDISKRNRPILGLPILLGLQPGKEREWDGNIYNADNGKTYKGNIRMKSENVLYVAGCVLGGLICGGEDWTRMQPSPDPAVSDSTCRQLDTM